MKRTRKCICKHPVAAHCKYGCTVVTNPTELIVCRCTGNKADARKRAAKKRRAGR